MDFAAINKLSYEAPNRDKIFLQLDAPPDPEGHAGYYRLVAKCFLSFLESGTREPHNYEETVKSLQVVFDCKNRYNELARAV